MPKMAPIFRFMKIGKKQKQQEEYNCSSQPSSVHWLSSSIFPCSVFCPSRYGNIRPNIYFFQYIQAKKPCNSLVPLHTKQYHVILTQYHQVPSSTALKWPGTIMYQLLLPSTDPVPAPYWPSTTKCQPVPPSTEPVPLYINQYHTILTQYHQVSTSINLYCCCMGITDFCTVYPGSFSARRHNRVRKMIDGSALVGLRGLACLHIMVC